jgi:sporulation protein YlmC with PRC-barrel domain
MLKTLMLTTAISSLLIGGAMAQSTASGAAATQTVSQQKPDQWLASKFKGTNVVGVDNQKIGDVTDILFDKNGKIEAYVVSVGGFLGIGSKEVALAPSSFQVLAADANSGGYERLKLSMSKDQLQQASNFERYNPPVQRQTTGMGQGLGQGSGLGGSGGMARPSTNTPPTGN